MTPEMSNILKEGFAKFKARTGLSNNEIADRLHCSASSVSLYCQGKTSITYETATVLLLMGMKISELFGEKTKTKPKQNPMGFKAKPKRNPSETQTKPKLLKKYK